MIEQEPLDYHNGCAWDMLSRREEGMEVLIETWNPQDYDT